MRKTVDGRRVLNERMKLIKLQAAIVEPALDELGLENLQALRDEVDRRVKGGGLRVGENPQVSMFGR